MRQRILCRFVMVFCGVFASLASFAQVDDTPARQDTLYIFDEEVIYDTLYLYDTHPQPALMSKEELLGAYNRDRGVGRLYYNKGRMYITGADSLIKLDNADLQMLFSVDEYSEYRKAKHQQYISIPLYVCAGGAAVFAGMGLYQFAASFVQTAKYSEQILHSERLGQDIWRSAMGGMFVFMGGAIVTAGFIVPAIVLTIRSKATINRITNNFNESGQTSCNWQLRAGPTPEGVGITLWF